MMDRRICFVGDSIVAGVGDPDRLGWVGRATQGIAGLTVYNLGVRGETSANIADRWVREVATRFAGVDDGRVVFSYGVNDSSLVNGRPRVDPAATVANTSIILQRCRWPALFVGPVPIANDDINARSSRLAGAIAAVCQQHGMPFLDVYPSLRADSIWMEEAAMVDGAHPGAAGYQRFAELVRSWDAWRAFVS